MLYLSSEMLECSFNVYVIIYSFPFFFHYLFGGRLKKIKIKDCKSKDSMGKINNTFKILWNKLNIIISCSWDAY